MKFIVLAGCLLATNLCFASNATAVIAEILVNLNHFPSADDKALLKEISIAADSSEEEKKLAAIVGRIAHKPAATDTAVLKQMSTEGSVAEIKVVADAILSINHKPGTKNIAALMNLVDH